jgi:hypothetical protein
MLAGAGFHPRRRRESTDIEVPENASCRSAPSSHPGAILPDVNDRALTCRCSFVCWRHPFHSPHDDQATLIGTVGVSEHWSH